MPLMQAARLSRWESGTHHVGLSEHLVQLSYQLDRGVNVFFLATPALFGA